MTTKTKVKAGQSTHFPVTEKVAVKDGDSKLTNSQADNLLTDPDDSTSGNTHSDTDPVFRGEKKPKVTAKKLKADAGEAGALDLPDDDMGGNTHFQEEDNPGDLPMIDTALEADAEFDDFAEDELNLASVEEGDEFSDLITSEIGEDDDEFGDDDMEDLDPISADAFSDAVIGDGDGDSDAEVEEDNVVADFENIQEDEGDVALVDVDSVPDDSVDGVMFATVGNAVHVLRSNRIIASMGPALARKAEVSDVYLLDQFQNVVEASLSKKGLRKGLVTAGFKLAKVKVTSAKATAKVVKAKVEAAVAQRMTVLAQNDSTMEQSLAIAATGINKQFFKDTPNALKANLVLELEALGLRGARNLVQSMFAQHGVDYAKSILTTAKRISAMPTEVRDNLVAALDMTDGEIETDAETDDADFAIDGEDDDMEELAAATSVTAALSRPQGVQRQAALLRASNGSSAAMQILSGAKSLV